MLKNLQFLIALSLVLLLAACSKPPRIDATDAHSFEESMVRVIEPLNHEQRELVADAIVVLLLSGAGAMNSDGDLPAGLRALHGMTANQIIEHAEAAIQARQSRDP